MAMCPCALPSCSKDTLHQVASHLHLADPITPHLPTKQLVELLAYKHERRVSQMDQINSMPIYPTEEVTCTHRHTHLHFCRRPAVSPNHLPSPVTLSPLPCPLYPVLSLLQVLWDENVVPMEFFSGEGCLALPKLNLQFLTLHDYLLRNFILFRLESTCKCASRSCA